MISRFYAKNYRGLQMDALELGRVNLFIGPNNSGKSNLFGALSFLFDMFGRAEEARGTLEAALARRANGPVVTRGAGGEARLEWEFGPPASYAVTLRTETSGATVIAGEEVRSEAYSGGPYTFHAIASGNSLSWSSDGPQAASGVIGLSDETRVRSILRHVPVARGRDEAEWRDVSGDYLLGGGRVAVEEVAARAQHLRLSSFVPSDAVEPQPAASARTLDDRGRNLVNLLHAWLAMPGFGARLVAELGVLLPSLEDVRVFEGGGYRWVQMKLDGSWQNLNELSDGTVTAVMLATLLFSPERRGTLCLDEPELNLHPAWARTVASWVLRQSCWEQVLVSTHSPEVLDPFTEHVQRGEVNLFVFQRADSGFRVEPCAPERLLHQLDAGWLLGDLYRIGEPALGGWPW